jgi:YjjI family glycine radical enzyme
VVGVEYKFGAVLSFEDLHKGLTAESLDDFRDAVCEVVRSRALQTDEKLVQLAGLAAKTQAYTPSSDEANRAIEQGILCLMGEPGRPFHFRYIAPDFARLLSLGSRFLELAPAKDLYDAVETLLTAYNYVPDHALLPVALGRIDLLLEPYIGTVPEPTARRLLTALWRLVDRLHPSGFVNANLGPEETRAGRLLLETDRDVKTITNTTFFYDPEKTPRGFALEAVRTALDLSKPYFFNYPLMLRDWGPNVTVGSCLNSMLVGGGVYTLVRLNLRRLAEEFRGSADEFIERAIPAYAKLQVEVVNSRVRYLVEDLGFLESSFLVREGILQRDRFTAYAGVVGLAQAVEILVERDGRPGARYGLDAGANSLAQRITLRLAAELKRHAAVYCDGSKGRVAFHAQVGIQNDLGTTPGVRVPVMQEPDLYEHLDVEGCQHEALDGGVSTILVFEPTARENPEAVLNIIEGALRSGVRGLSVGCADSEYVRVTGYLVRRSDIEGARTERQHRRDTDAIVADLLEKQPQFFNRRVRSV